MIVYGAALRRKSVLAAPALGAGLGLAVAVTGAFVVTIGIALVTLVIVSLRLTSHDKSAVRHRTLRWTVGAFGFHVIAGLVIWHVSRLTNYLGPDALTYQSNASAILQHWMSGAPMPSDVGPGKSGFAYMLASIYWIVGNRPDVGLVVNALAGAALIPIVFDATRRRFGVEAARAVPPLLILMPGFALWPSQLLRDPIIYVLIATSLNCAVRVSTKTSPLALMTMCGALALLLTFRADVAFLVAMGFILALIVSSTRAVNALASGAAMFGLLSGLVVAVGLGYGGYHLITSSSFQQLNVIHQGSAQSASGFGGATDISSPAKSASYLPLGLTNFMLGPFPWQIHGVRQLPALPDVLAWWFLLPSLWRGLREAARRYGRRVALDALPALVLAALLSLIFTNFGTVVRERMQIILLLVPLVSLGWTLRHKRTQPAAEASLFTPQK